MDSLFDPACHARTLERLGRLRPDSPRGWGKMSPAQAMAHCAKAMETATGDAVLSRPLLARLIGPLFKGSMLSPKPYSKNSPTHPELVMSAPADFEKEKARLLAVLKKFHEGGPATAAKYEHGFVGRITGDEWGRLMHKHMDHHLGQFGV